MRIRGGDGKWCIVSLDAGDVLVFRGNVHHNGLGYLDQNVRVHAYLYPRGYDPGPHKVHFDLDVPLAETHPAADARQRRHTLNSSTLRTDVPAPAGPSAQTPAPTADVDVTQSHGYELLLSSGSATGYQGVTYANGKFRARAGAGTRASLGTWETAVQAAVAVARARAADAAPAE